MKKTPKKEDGNDLTRCQWIEGEASSRAFCGRERKPGSRGPWCEEHYGRVYTGAVGVTLRTLLS
jgi:hypothetical protein